MGRGSARAPGALLCVDLIETRPSFLTCAGTRMDIVAQHLLNGLMQGTMYGLVAMGFTLFFGVMNVIKFSHGDVLTLGAFGALATAPLLQSAGMGAWPQILAMFVVAVLATALIGTEIARFFVLPLRHSPTLNILLLTMMLG